MLRYILILLFVFGSITYDGFAEESPSISKYKLNLCIAVYRDGFYSQAIQCIGSALPVMDTHSDSLEAYKMLAQSYGMLNQIAKAKEYFNIILEHDSSTVIDTLELPPNISLVYNQVLLERKLSQMEKAHTQDTVTIQKKKSNVAIPALLLSSAVLSLGGGGYCGYKAYTIRKDNLKTGNNHFMSNNKMTRYTRYLAGSAGCAAVAGVTTVLFIRVVKKGVQPHVYSSGNGITLTYDF
jgi:tetratricopeptide (TPR) repeat protein